MSTYVAAGILWMSGMLLIVNMAWDLVRKPERVSPLWYVSLLAPVIAGIVSEGWADIGTRTRVRRDLLGVILVLAFSGWLHAACLAVPRSLRPGGDTSTIRRSTYVLLTLSLILSIAAASTFVAFDVRPFTILAMGLALQFWRILFLAKSGPPRRETAQSVGAAWWSMGSFSFISVYPLVGLPPLQPARTGWVVLLGVLGVMSLLDVWLQRSKPRHFAPLALVQALVMMAALYIQYVPLVTGVEMPTGTNLIGESATEPLDWDGGNLFEPDGTRLLKRGKKPPRYRYAATAPSTNVGPVPIAMDGSRRVAQFEPFVAHHAYRTLTLFPEGLRLDGEPTAVPMGPALHARIHDIPRLAIVKNPKLSVQDVVTICESTIGPCSLIEP